MKIFLFILLSIIFNSIFSIERYNLTDGEEIKVDSLVSTNIYEFCINATYFKISNVELRMNNMDPMPFSSIGIYEYSNNSDQLSNENVSINLFKNNSELASSFYYSIQNHKTSFIVFRIQPTKNIDYFKIKIDITNSDYDISDGIPRNITNLKKDIYYHFLIPINSGKTCSINITLNFAETYVPKVLILTNEYIDRKTPNAISNGFDYPLSESDPRILHRYDIYSYNTEYLDFAFLNPFSDINYLIIQMDISKDITLRKGNSKEKNFDYDYPYNFFISTTLLEQSLISLTLDHISEEPFKYLYIREYSPGRASKKGYSSITVPDIIKTNVGNNLVLNFTYKVSNEETNYISLSLKFNDVDIKTIESNIDIDGGAFDIYRYGINNITNLMPGYYYYLFIKSHNYQSLNITLNYSSTNSLSSVGVQEYSEKNSFNLLREKHLNISSSTLDNNFITFFKYNIKEEYNDTNYTAVVINPSVPIGYVLTKVDFLEHKYILPSQRIVNTFYDLEPEYKYYVFTPMENKKRKIKVTISVSDKYDKPISQITILDLKNSDDINSYDKKEEFDLANNKYTSDLIVSHVTSSSDIKTVVLIIKPKYKVDKMMASFEYSFYLSTGIIILIASICAVVLIAIIVIIIIVIKKRRGGNVSTEIDSYNNEQPLYEN